MCLFLSQTSSHACFSFSPYGLGFGLPVGPRGTQAKAAYRVHLFFSHARILVRLCMDFLGLPIQSTTKHVAQNHRKVLFHSPGG